MHFERKVYETRSQKVGDFFLGVGLFIALNVAFSVMTGLLVSVMGSMTGLSNNSVAQTLSSLLLFLFYVLPFVIQIALMIYFGLTRYWIALGMLGAFAASLLLVLLFVAVCFALISGYGHP